ncbi:MAG: hypothetical protein KAH38_03680 [Candidatus Hydrogenedentes bacterium]|nr:hypothetical protein [Candidatus Hydrogenedentota bacterium]
MKYAGEDCQVLQKSLISGLLKFSKDWVLLLDDRQEANRRPTSANIHSFLGSWLAAPGEDDLDIVYFAGYGRLMNGKTYLVQGIPPLPQYTHWVNLLGTGKKQGQQYMN